MSSERGDAVIPLWQLKRYRLCFLVWWGFAVVYALRVNLSVAIVDMVNTNGTKNDTGECANKSVHYNGGWGYESYAPVSLGKIEKRFDWTDEQQGTILGAFFYGYITTQLLGGYLADRFGAKILFGAGVACTAVLTIVTEPVASWGFGWMVALRVIEGIGEGVTFPAISSFWGKWAPPNERASLAGMSFSGAQFGTVLSMPLSGLLCHSLGWPVMFYIFGGISCVWVVLWFWIAEDTPEKYTSMDPIELRYIKEQLPSTTAQKKAVPWVNIWCSLPFWGLLVTHVCYNWTFYAILTYLPKYLNNVHGFDLSQAGFISALPYICMFTVIVIHYLLRNKIWSRTAVRRVFNSIGLIVPAISLAFITTLNCDTDAVIAMICICCGFSGFIFSGYNTPNHADLAPAYAGTLFGITNMMGTIPGFAAPQANGAFIEGHNDEVSAWAPVWYLACGMNLFGGITYALLASGDEQPWSTKKISVKYQMQFEVNQLCFRTIDPDEVPILEGESESSDETARENPNFED